MDLALRAAQCLFVESSCAFVSLLCNSPAAGWVVSVLVHSCLCAPVVVSYVPLSSIALHCRCILL